MTTILISPSEPSSEMVKSFEKRGYKAFVSSIPEERGSDYLIFLHKGVVCVQRKEIPFDFLSSVQDGRLARETALMQGAKFKWVIGEGRFKYFPDGTIDTGLKNSKILTRFTKTAVNKIIIEIKLIMGVNVDFSTDMDDTAGWICDLCAFINDPKHTALISRPGMRTEWGIPPEGKEMDCYLLQGFHGIIGPGLASKIIEHFGRVPLMWDCEFQQLMQVPGIGYKRAEKLWKRLNP